MPKKIKRPKLSDAKKLQEITELIEHYGQIDEAHHKQWVIDQVMRIVRGGDYPGWVKFMKSGEDGPNTNSWDVGIAP